ncbi:alpha/beta hydrolase [Brevibacillus migulae]|uniref:alpha/beta hydrolase n=1 Tax=Brevibacillus migulae TaxID=1644114 RepID=UPI00106E46FB|nr:alpha/beta fold hydrolase [Brevibacillus migulae]
MEKHVQIPVTIGSLAATLHVPDRQGSVHHKWPLIIICHGFVGSRIGVDRLFVQAGRSFSAQDFMVLRFDYAGCGESEGDYGTYPFPDLVEQTIQVIDFAEQLPEVDPDQIFLIGHSLGGAVATYAAARDSRVKSLVLWSPVAYPFRDIVQIVGEDILQQVQKHRAADYLGYALSPVFFQSLSEAQPLTETKDVAGDVLVVHGSNDEEIPPKYCFYYQKAFRFRPRGVCDKEIIVGANHTFSHGAHKRELFACTSAWISQRASIGAKRISLP